LDNNSTEYPSTVRDVPSVLAVISRTALVAFVFALLISISDGVGSFSLLHTLGVVTGPFTFLWWPYFRNEIGLQPLLGLLPIGLIIFGALFRRLRSTRWIAYLGGAVWVLVGFIYVVGHID
jgi:hypothetical protein